MCFCYSSLIRSVTIFTIGPYFVGEGHIGGWVLVSGRVCGGYKGRVARMEGWKDELNEWVSK